MLGNATDNRGTSLLPARRGLVYAGFFRAREIVYERIGTP